jgi:hypothetical protein
MAGTSQTGNSGSAGETAMSRRAIHRLLSITALAWLCAPVAADNPLRKTGGARDNHRAGLEGKLTDQAGRDALMPSSRLKRQHSSPYQWIRERNGSDMHNKTLRHFIATTRAHWLDDKHDKT